MPWNAKTIEPEDFSILRTLSLSEEDGEPVLYMCVKLKTNREYDPEPTALYLPGISPRWLHVTVSPEPVVASPVEPVTVEEPTVKQEAGKREEPVPPVGDGRPANGKKGKSDTAPEPVVPPVEQAATVETPKVEVPVEKPATRQGG
jgi:hypothetical protein